MFKWKVPIVLSGSHNEPSVFKMSAKYVEFSLVRYHLASLVLCNDKENALIVAANCTIITSEVYRHLGNLKRLFVFAAHSTSCLLISIH